ncbi:MAG: ADP-ribosylglycohydrolase family protein [Actinomycetia bacterium]|nr:ADP-ribosylglycohydrolase family protein [Actinomycetes bacterium]
MASQDYSPEELRALLPWLSATIPVPPSPLDPAPPEPDSARVRRLVGDRVRGMLLGLAIGDALGNTSEAMTPAERRETYGETRGDGRGDIRDYLPNRREDMRAVGLPSDDTQLAFWTLESLLRRGCLDPVSLADTFTRGDRIYGIGATITAFLKAYRREGKRWFEAGRPSAGNGALMRIAPVLLPHLRSMSWRLWEDVIVATVLTHRDEAAVAASVGFVGLLAECLTRGAARPAQGFGEGGARAALGAEPGTAKGSEGPGRFMPGAAPGPAERDIPARWWPETFLKYARAVETSKGYDCGGRNAPFHGSLCDRVEQAVFPAIASDSTVLEAAERWYSGAFLLETVPCVLFILARHGNDPEEAIVRAVNDTYDNDTIAAVVGAAVGALHGKDALPGLWRAGLVGRTREEDDGRVQELVERAVETYVTGRSR